MRKHFKIKLSIQLCYVRKYIIACENQDDAVTIAKFNFCQDIRKEVNELFDHELVRVDSVEEII